MKDIADFEEQIAKKFRSWFVQNIQLQGHLGQTSEDLQDILNKHDRLICVMNHGGFLGPWAAALAYHYVFLTHGGQHRKPTGVAWRGFYSLPIYKHIAQCLTQRDTPLAYNDCKDLLLTHQFNDLIILPEGTNCHYFDGEHIQPFVSPRFVELSIETQTPILLLVHQGSEHWSHTFAVPKALSTLLHLLPRRYREGLEQNRLINVPHMFKGRIQELNVVCTLYQPTIHPSGLTNKAEAKEIIGKEATRIRTVMQSHYTELLAFSRHQKLSTTKDDQLEHRSKSKITHPCVEVA